MVHNLTGKQAVQPGQLKGHHVLVWLLCFFGLIFVVNGYFLYNAITTFPGEDTKKSYLQGLEYNRILENRAQQAALGWRAEMGMSGKVLEIRLENRDGSAVAGYDVNVLLRRMATSSDDVLLEAVSRGQGSYLVDMTKLSPGQWDAVASVSDGEDGRVLFEARKRVVLK